MDKDAFSDKDGNFGFVITNQNPPGYLFGYIKYTFTGTGLWKGYDRILKYYGVHNLMRSPQTFSMEPCYGVEFPVIYRSQIRRHILPEDVFEKVITNEKKINQSDTLFSLLDKVPNSRLGVTGSILLGIQHERSDIDLVIYGCKAAEDFMGSFKGGQPDPDWIAETSKNYSLDVSVVKGLYDIRTRGVYRSIKYSFSFVDDRPHPYCRDVCEVKEEVEVEGELEGDCNSLFYPSIAYLYARDFYEIVSWEGIFSTALYKSKRVRIKGVRMECSKRQVILIGDRRTRGFVQVL
ncbi:hypothetical protein [Metallosphaera hakonensis]|uniref:hypothetical protein n=1 Tax=Metallosphaera hakonensis TaxID=79601 RepID=UPI001F0E7959|nr:hypothetical protein [Metallosphaera hakonensis]